MTTTLQNICKESIIKTICNTPQSIQEMIIGETREQIREEIRKELRTEIENKEKQLYETISNTSYLISDIINDIIFSMTNHNVTRKNFYEEWPHIPRKIIKLAISIAEITVSELDNHLIYPNFNLLDRYDVDIDEDSDVEYFYP